MAEDEEATSEEGSGAEEAAPRRKLPRRLILMIGGGAFVFLILVGVVLYLVLGGSSKQAASEAKPEETAAAAPAPAPEAKPDDKNAGPFFVDMDDLIVNLAMPPGKKPSYLKLKVTLELDRPDTPALDAAKPRIVDTFQVYLRELRPEDLQGSVGVVRLKEELLQRVNAAVAPIEVRAVLFKDFLVQ